MSRIVWILAGAVLVTAIGSPKSNAESVFVGVESAVIEYDLATGSIIRSFPVNTAVGVTAGPDGNIYVADQTRAQSDYAEIDKIQPRTGAISVFATDGIDGIYGITFGPNGNLYASSACGPGSPACSPTSPKVVEYNGLSGAVIGIFIEGPLPPAGGIAFGPNGNLFIGGDGEVVEYDGVTGSLIGNFASTGVAHALLFAGGVIRSV